MSSANLALSNLTLTVHRQRPHEVIPTTAPRRAFNTQDMNRPIHNEPNR